MTLNLETWADISDYQNHRPGNDTWRPISFDKMRDAGAVGVAIRKSLGKVHDPSFERNWVAAGAAGLKRTIYWVPYVNFDMVPQLKVAGEWPSGGVFDEHLDIPAWVDVERRPIVPAWRVLPRLMQALNWTKAFFGVAEIYTAQSVWDTYYSRKLGWWKDWELVVANYQPQLYHLATHVLKSAVATQGISPAAPIGWRLGDNGRVLPSEKQWRQWQISADGNGQGPAFGVNSAAIDISFRQIRTDPEQPPDKMVELREAFGELRMLHNRETEVLAEIAAELGVT